MSRSVRSILGASLGLVAAFVLASAVAQAGDIDNAKENGQIGERFDGFLGVVDEDAPSDVKALVENINLQRREQYADVAEKNNVPLAQVGRIAGAKLIERTRDGQFVLPAPGDDWIQKQAAQ